MHKVTLARNEISPLLNRLIQQLEAEGRLTQRAHFRRIQRRIEVAHNDWDLKSPIIDLSSAAAMGFKFSSVADALVVRILDKTQVLVDELAGEPMTRH
jgi:hypothetical protein